MDRQEADEGNRPGRPDPDAAGAVVSECLLPQDRHVQHFDRDLLTFQH